VDLAPLLLQFLLIGILRSQLDPQELAKQSPLF